MKKFSLANSLSTMGLAFSVLATAAQAGEPVPAQGAMRDTRVVSVRYTQADLASPEGVQALYVKLERASRQACRRADDRGLSARADVRNCRAGALDAAVAQVKNVRLGALHRERSGAAVNGALVAAADSANSGQ